MVTRKRKVVEDEVEPQQPQLPQPQQKKIKKQLPLIKFRYLENFNKKKEIKEECDLITTKEYNLVSENREENIFPKIENFFDEVFKELQNEDIKEHFHMMDFNYSLNFNIFNNNGISSVKLGEIEIKPELIKTHMRFFIIQTNDDEKNIDNIKKNIFEKNNNLNITTLLDETIELRNDLNHPFTQHSINIDWKINEDWSKEKLNKYYWGYQVIRPLFFLNDLNFGIKDLEEKIIKYNDGTNNGLREEVKNEIDNRIEKFQEKFQDQLMVLIKQKICDEMICQKN
jgi:hypothetical protein